MLEAPDGEVLAGLRRQAASLGFILVDTRDIVRVRHSVALGDNDLRGDKRPEDVIVHNQVLRQVAHKLVSLVRPVARPRTSDHTIYDFDAYLLKSEPTPAP